MSKLSLLFPGCEVFDSDINVNINTTGDSGDVASAATEAEDLATEGAETQSEAEETSTAAEAFAHQFSELCALHKHIARFGVDRTLLALCNRNNILGRALNLRLPSMESFDSVGSPRSATSIACLEALSEGLWAKFKEFISKIVKAIKNFFLKMGQWWRDISGNYETRLKQFEDFFGKDGTNASFKKKDDLDGFKGFFMGSEDIDSIISDYTKFIGGTGGTDKDADAAARLVTDANKVIDAVLRAGSSDAAQTTSLNSATLAGRDADKIKALADELGEKAQEARDKVLDKLEEARDKFNEKFDDKISDAKEKDASEILSRNNNSYDNLCDNNDPKAASDFKLGTNVTFCNSNYPPTCPWVEFVLDAVKIVIGEIRKSEERNSLLSPALKTALDRLERNAISKNEAGMDLDTREAITRSVSTAQQILTKAGSMSTFWAKIVNLMFKNLSTIKSMCKSS